MPCLLVRLWQLTALVVALYAATQSTLASAQDDDDSDRPFDATAPMADEPLSILDGRLSLRVPVHAAIEPRRDSVMAATPAAQAETRVVYRAGARKLVVMAYELFARESETDFVPSLTAHLESWGLDEYDTGELELNGMQTFQLGVREPDVERETVFLRAMFVRHSDGGIIAVYAFVDQEGATDLDAARGLINAVFTTVAEGRRQLDLAARQVTLGADEAERLTLELRDGMCVTSDVGPDFVVYRIRRIGRLSDQLGELGIYFGGAPNRHTFEGELSKVRTRLFGERLEWERYTVGTAISEQAYVAHPRAEDVTLHVWVTAPNEDEHKLLHAILVTLTVPAIEDDDDGSD